MATASTSRAILSGKIVGRIWQGMVCYKYVRAEIVRSDESVYVAGGPFPSLRDAMLHLTNDGDFQSCGFEYASLDVVRSDNSGPTLVRRGRSRDIRFACWDTDDMQASPEGYATLEVQP